MENKYYKILKQIEDNGFVSYIVGGYVRDILLKRPAPDVDIITNATPKDLKKIFNNISHEYTDYGAVKLYVKDHIIDITTFRKELSYVDGKPKEIEYINSLEEDLKRRDFIVNTLVMDSEENIIDLLGAKEDIKNKVLRCVREEKIELTEDPSRILRALRFMNNLNFELSPTLKEFIISNKELIKEININKRKEELDKLFKSKRIDRFVNFVKENDLEEYIGVRFNKVVSSSYTISKWACVELLDNFNFSKNEKEQIKEIKSLINKGKIDKIDIYKKGLFISTAAAEILGISKKVITNEYNNLPIKEKKEIDIKAEEICEVLNISPSVKLGNEINKIEKLIINGKLENKKEEIIKYLKRK